MKRKALKILRTALISAFCATLSLGTIASIPRTVQAETITNANELFVNSSGVTVTKAAAAPDKFQTYDGKEVARDFDIGMEGVRLTAEENGSTVALAPTFAGDFSMTFRAYSDVSFGSDNASEFSSTSYNITPYADLKEIHFIFEDEKGQTFTVAMTAGERYNVITPSARVILGDAEIAYHYLNDDTQISDTDIKNPRGFYCRMGGTTFCNVARRNAALTSEDSLPVTFGYDADEMQIFVMHYGTNKKLDGHYRVILDLDDPSTGLHSLKSFENYKVSVEFTSIAEKKDANIIVYDINGQSLAGETFANNIGAETIVGKDYEGVKGEKYYLPTPTAFDLLDGIVEYDGTVSVNGGNYTVYDAQGQATTTWSKGCYFIPKNAGKYEITYKAKDLQGNYGAEKVIVVNAFETVPETQFIFDGNYKAFEGTTVEYGKGTSLWIYEAVANGALIVGDDAKKVYVTLKKDGQVYKNIDNVLASTQEVVLDEVGEYSLTYSTGLYSNFIKKEIKVLVTNTAPKLTYSKTMPTKAVVGNEYNIPKLTAETASGKKLASSTLYAPDGSKVTVSSGKAKIEEVGTYKISYTVRFDKVYTYDIYFDAYYNNENVFIVEDTDKVTAELGDSGSLFTNAMTGTLLTYTAENAWAKYDKVIDLSKNSVEDPLIKIMVVPSRIGMLDYWQYTVRLTDVHNPSVYVDILVYKGSWGNEYSYVKAGSNEQVPAGWEMDKVLTSVNAGCPINYSFTGESILGTELATLYYDYDNQAVHVGNIKRPGYSYGNQVIDLDDTDCFPENFLFDGFTTGEVYLSISVQFMQADFAQLLVTEVNGTSISEKWLDDKIAPVISVDVEDYTENQLPVGLTGTAYPIFKAEAFDSVDGWKDVSVKVYKGFQTAAQQEIAVTNNSFIPTATGAYSIVYKATDKSGNTSEKVLNVTVADSLADFEYIFESTFDTTYNVGEYFNLPLGKVIGGSGKVDVTLRLTSPDNKQIDYSNGYMFDKDGEYTFSILFEDYLGRTFTKNYEIEVAVSDKPVLYEVPLFKSMLNGATYVLPECEAIDYSTGTLQKLSTAIKVVYNGQETILGADRKFTPAVQNHQDTIKIVYSATNASGQTTEMEYEVTVLIVNVDGGIDMSRYFKLDNAVAIEKADSYVEFETETDGATLSFVNPLIVNNLQFELYVPAAKNNFSSFTVTYTDSIDKTVARSITIYKGVESANYSYFTSGGERKEVAGNFFDKTSYGFSIKFNNNSNYFYDCNANLNLTKALLTDEGREFVGFPSGKVYLTVTFNGVTDTSALRVMLIGNQNFSNLTSDRVAPQMQLSAFLERSAEINKPFTVPSAMAADVLNSEVQLTLTIKRGSQTIYSGAIDKDYVFTPTEYGPYRVTYEASAGGRKASTTYQVIVKDQVKPTLSLNGNVPTNGKVGEVMNLPTATANDNNSSNMRIWIFITKPNGRMVTLATGATSYTPDEKGEYKVSYYVEDEYANYTYYHYTVNVK